jgi:oligopeptide/dipeptide ABC transporter ATP-binding protein
LDEPVSALDVSTQAQTVAMLADLQQQLGVAYLLIAHDLPLVRHLSHWVIVMYQGIVLEEGPTAQIYERPRHPYTQALLSLVPSSAHPRTPIVLPGELPGPSDDSVGCRFRARGLYAFSDCSQEPPLLGFGDAGRVACHLHTTGPTLGGQSVDLLLDDAVRAVPIAVRSATPNLVSDSTQGEP